MNLRPPRGIRNNNPGNIRHGQNWQGLNPEGRNIDPAFCVFKSPVFGIRALAKVLMNYKKIHGLNTVRQIISRYKNSPLFGEEFFWFPQITYLEFGRRLDRMDKFGLA